VPLDLLDSSTWLASVLDTPNGPVTYWQLADLDAYYEKNERDGNLATTLIAVPWADRVTWKKYALGTAKAVTNGYLDRWTPLPWPYSDAGDLYLTSVDKIKVHVGNAATSSPRGEALFHRTDPMRKNWFTLPTQTGLPPRIVYRATFGNYPYRIVDQDAFRAGTTNELRRNVIRERESRPRERKIPSMGFETDEVSPVVIPEVGFVPYVDYEFTYTWVGVPEDDVPWTAIGNHTLKINENAFDIKKDGTFGKYKKGDILFCGLAGKIRPYRGPDHSWLIDLPYVFRWQPADGVETGGRSDGMLKVPRNNGTWIKIRERGSVASPKYLYGRADLDTLFQPEPL